MHQKMSFCTQKIQTFSGQPSPQTYSLWEGDTPSHALPLKCLHYN